VVEHDAWDAVRRARRTDRPSARDYLADVFDTAEELRGDRMGEDDHAVLAAVARLGGRSVVVVGMDRRAVGDGPDRRPGQPRAAGYRKLRRALELAARHDLPVVSLIDTPGADPSPASERSGLAGMIAETFVATLAVPAPTVGVVIGEGGSGGALAIGATDRLLMQDDSVFEVIAPEGAASILHRDPTRAQEVAPLIGPTASVLRREGIIDRIVPGPTTFDPHTARTALRSELAATLAELDADGDRLARRSARYGPRHH
jgi:acetyl-CoA carboxylase carboxyl transferase subunit beta